MPQIGATLVRTMSWGGSIISRQRFADSSTRFDVNLEADSTSFLGPRPLAARSRGGRDAASIKNGLLSFELRPSLRTKLLMAFFAIEVLLVSVGVIGLLSLREADQRANQVVGLQQKIEAYRQMQHNTLRQLYGVSTALAFPNETTVAVVLRQTNQFGYDLDRVSFVARDEVALLNQVRENMRASLPSFHIWLISSAAGERLRPSRVNLRNWDP
jgi:hypothetical protein